MVRTVIGLISIFAFLVFVTPVHAQQNQRYWQQRNRMRANATNNYYYNSYRAPQFYLPTPIYYPNYNYYQPGYYYSYPSSPSTTILPPRNDNRLPTGGSNYFGDPHASQYFGNPNASQYFGN